MNKFFWFAIVVGGVLFLLSLFFWRYAIFHENTHIDRLTSRESKNLVFTIRQTFDRKANMLKNIAKYWQKQKVMSKAQWLKYVSNIRADSLDVQAIEWVDKQYIVRWIEPLAGNEAAQNLNLAFEERRRVALESAKNRKTITMSKVVNLVQGGKGVLLYYPLFLEGKFHGFIVGVFRINTMLAPLLGAAYKGGYGVVLHDENELLYISNFSSIQKKNFWVSNQQFKVFGKVWHLKIWPGVGLVNAVKSHFPLLALASGIIFSLLISVLLIMLGVLKRSQVNLQRKNSEVDLIYQATTLLNDAESFEAALQQSVNLICAANSWPVGHIYNLAVDGRQLLVSSNIWYCKPGFDITDFREVTTRTTFEEGIGLPGRIWALKKPTWIEDVQQDGSSPRAKLCHDLKLHAAFGFPIIIAGKVIAVLEFFTDTILKKNDAVLNQFAMLSAQLSRAWSKRQIESEVKEREAKYRALFETAVEVIIVFNDKGVVQECNDMIKKVLGYSPDQVIGKNVSMLMPEPDKAQHDGYIGQYLKTGEKKIIDIGREVLAMHKSGQIIPVHLSISEVEIHGERHFVGMLRDITDEVEAKERLETLAHYDYLTGLANRALFNDKLADALAYAKRACSSFAIVYMDLDGFKEINDTRGHHVGDLVLVEFAKRLKETLRQYDTVARIGGDEFVLILRDVKNSDEISCITDKIIHSMSKPFRLDQGEIVIEISIGVALYPSDADSAEALLKRSDKALYVAKLQSGNSVGFYHSR